MDGGRHLFLDIALAVGIAVVYYVSAVSEPSSRHLYHAVLIGLGVFLFVRFFVRQFLGASPTWTPERLRRQLRQIEEQEEHFSQWNREQQINFLEQSGAIALALERWPLVLRWYGLLASLLEQEQHDNLEQQEEIQIRLFHVHLALCFALLRDGQVSESLEKIQQLKQSQLARKDPIFSLLAELFHIRVVSQDDPKQGEQMLHALLHEVQQHEHEEEALRLVALEWLEMGKPETAIDLLQKAIDLAEKREDAVSEAETLYQLGYAYGEAGHLQQAAQTLVRLTRRYVQINVPSSEQIEQLRQKFYERFGTRNFQTAYHHAEKQVS